MLLWSVSKASVPSHSTVAALVPRHRLPIAARVEINRIVRRGSP